MLDMEIMLRARMDEAWVSEFYRLKTIYLLMGDAIAIERT
jgi:hypothetical protein